MLVTQEQQPVWNAIITDVFREFIDICQRNNLTYYCCGGTAIGAVRHHGIIPWDDDIDVFMPRPDYDKFLELAEKVIEFTGSKSKIVFEPLPQDDPKMRRPDISLAKEKLDWEPKVKLDEGLKKTIEYFKTTI